MSTNSIKFDDIIDLKKSWKDILNYNKDYIPEYKAKRVKDYLDNCWDKSLNKDLDLATLLIILRSRNCKIELPSYKNQTVKKIKDNIEKVSNKTFGEIRGLVSNQYTFSFSILVNDEKYKEEKLNCTFDYSPRTYNITDVNGNFNNIWSNFTFNITDNEKEYFNKNIGIWDNIKCTKFVNPQIAQAFYTEYYYNNKVLVDRLVAERKYLSDLKKKYIKLCKTFSNNEFELTNSANVVKEDKEKFESIKILCFEAIPTVPEKTHWNFDYIDEKKTPEEIVADCDNYMDGLIGVTSDYKFICRLIELAFTKMNPFKENLCPSDFQTYNDRFPCKWNPIKIKLPKCRIEWFELMFKTHSLLCRYYYKSIQQKNNKD